MNNSNLEQTIEEAENIHPLETEIKKEQEVEKDKKEPKAFKGIELSVQEKARYADLITNVEKMKVIDDLDTHLPNVDPSELTLADLDMLEKYLKIRRAGFKPEAVAAFDKELLDVQSRPEELKGSPHYFLRSLRTKVTFQASDRFKEEMKNIEEGRIKEEEEPPEYRQEQLDDFRRQVKRLKGADRNKKLQDIMIECLGEEEHEIWKKFKQFTNEGWPKIRISELKRLLREHKPVVKNLDIKGEGDKAKSIKNFLEYLEEEVDKEVEKSEE